MACHFSMTGKKSFRKKVVNPENSDLKYLSLTYGHAENTTSIKEKTGAEEWLIVILQGEIGVKYGNGKKVLLTRKNVFDSDPFSLYLPPNTDFEITMKQESELLAVSAPVSGNFSPSLIKPDMLKKRKIGGRHYYRNIRDILTEDFNAGKIIAGETINDPGNWSSYPPHKHDVDRFPDEIRMEEVYFFKIRPEKTGFGVIRVYDKEESSLFLLKNNEVVTIPKGYHPVGVIPGHQIYYFWALAGEKRILRPNTHPGFKKL